MLAPTGTRRRVREGARLHRPQTGAGAAGCGGSGSGSWRARALGAVAARQPQAGARAAGGGMGSGSWRAAGWQAVAIAAAAVAAVAAVAAERASHILCKCGPVRQSPCCSCPLILKTKTLLFLQLFSIADPRPSSKVGNELPNNQFAALLRCFRHLKVLQQSAIAKKLQKSRDFCFCASGTTLLDSASWSNVAADTQGQRWRKISISFTPLSHEIKKRLSYFPTWQFSSDIKPPWHIGEPMTEIGRKPFRKQHHKKTTPLVTPKWILASYGNSASTKSPYRFWFPMKETGEDRRASLPAFGRENIPPARSTRLRETYT